MSNHRVGFDINTHRSSRTKMEILRERRDFLQKEAEYAQSLIDGLEGTPCGLKCSGCLTVLETEADFASHFIVKDEAFLNLGSCPYNL